MFIYKKNFLKTADGLDAPVGAETPPKDAPPNGSKKPVAKPKKDSPEKLEVKQLQNAILRYKESLESLDIASKDNPGKQVSNQDRRSEQRLKPGESLSPQTHKEYWRDSIRQTIPLTEVGRTKPDPNLNLKGKEFLGGTNPLGTFLINNYLNTKGLSYSDLDVNDKDRKGQSVAPYDFRSLVETIGHVGTPKAERPQNFQERALQNRINNILKTFDSNDKAKANKAQTEIDALLKQYQAEKERAKIKFTNNKQEHQLIDEKFLKKKNEIYRKYQFNELLNLQNQLSNLKIKLDADYEKKNPGLGEEKVDGIFHQRTLNALQIISAITKSFLDFSKDMGEQVTNLSKELTKYNGVVNIFANIVNGINSGTVIKFDAKKQALDALTSSIDSQAKFIKDEFKQIIESENVKSYITQEHSFMAFNRYKSDPEKEAKETESMFSSVDGSTHSTLKSNYLKAYKSTYQPGSAGIAVNFNNKQLVLNYESLWTTANLANTFKSTFGKTPTKEELAQFLDAIKESINQGINMIHYQKQVNEGYRAPQAPQEKPRTPWEAINNAKLPRRVN